MEILGVIDQLLYYANICIFSAIVTCYASQYFATERVYATLNDPG